MTRAQTMRLRYDGTVADTYPTTDFGRPGYAEYRAALEEGSAGLVAGSVLDLGCGTGRYLHCLQNVGCLVGIDVSKAMLSVASQVAREVRSLAKTKVILLAADFTALDFAPDSFDFIYCIGVVGELIPCDVRFLRKLGGWLGPNGTAFFTVVQASEPTRSSTMRSVLHRVAVRLADSTLIGIVPSRVRRRVLFGLDYSHLYLSEAELADLISFCLPDCEFSLSFFADAKNRKIGCTLRRKEGVRSRAPQ